MCTGAALAQTGPALVAAVSGATAAKLALQKVDVKRAVSKQPVVSRGARQRASFEIRK